MFWIYFDYIFILFWLIAGAMIERSHHFSLWMRTNSTRWTSTTHSRLERFFKSFEVCIKSLVSTRRIIMVIKSSNLDISVSGVWSHWQWTNFEGIAHYHSSWSSFNDMIINMTSIRFRCISLSHGLRNDWWLTRYEKRKIELDDDEVSEGLQT